METNGYLDMFLDESREHLQAINDQLLNLEDNPQDMAIVGEIFRSAHTLKGMAATMDFTDIADLTHKMENVLDDIRDDKMTVTTSILDVLLEAVEALENMVESVALGGDGKSDVSHLLEQLNSIGKEDETAATSEQSEGLAFDEFERSVIEQSQQQGFHSFRIHVVLTSDCVLKAARTYMVFEVLETLGEVIKSEPPVEMLEEEQFDFEFSVVLLSKADSEEIEQKVLQVAEIDQVRVSELELSETKRKDDEAPPTRQTAKQTKPQAEQKRVASSSKTIRVNIERLNHLMNLFEELVIDRGRLEELAKKVENDELSETVERITRVSGDLQDTILTMRMVPIEQVFNRFPRMVRSLAKELEKHVDFEVFGSETELDRTIIDEIGDPLVHLIRNSLDHGIEQPETREKMNKPTRGKVVLKAYHSGNHVFIEIEDDGAGLDKDKLLQKAIEKEVISRDDATDLADEEINQLIFASGFSTSEEVSDVSGRGVGLDAVKSKIESLGGHVSVESVPHEGSRFTIQLPLTLSIIDALLVEVGTETYAIPLTSIIETAIIQADDIETLHQQEVIDFRGSVVPIIYLSEVFAISDETNREDDFSVVIAKKGDRMAAIVVDSFIGQQEVVLKPLGSYLQNVFAISGATILGDGQVALIVDCNALIK